VNRIFLEQRRGIPRLGAETVRRARACERLLCCDRLYLSGPYSGIFKRNPIGYLSSKLGSWVTTVAYNLESFTDLHLSPLSTPSLARDVPPMPSRTDTARSWTCRTRRGMRGPCSTTPTYGCCTVRCPASVSLFVRELKGVDRSAGTLTILAVSTGSVVDSVVGSCDNLVMWPTRSWINARSTRISLS
jgi:hypothetical protein